MSVKRMVSGRSRGRRLLPLLALVPVVVFAAFLLSAPSPSGSNATGAERPPILRFERDGLLFTYHVPTGTEGLFDLASDPRCLKNLVKTRGDAARRLRRELERALAVRDLSELLDPDDVTVKNLKGLGYM